jgi:hypothetical protein
LIDRPFIPAGEAPRPYSEVRSEQSRDRAEGMIEQIHQLEAQAREEIAAGDEIKAVELQLEAEALRVGLYHQPRQRGLQVNGRR